MRVDRYLNEIYEDISKDLDILSWWKVNSDKYKALSFIARDIMAILMTNVASESAFLREDEFLIYLEVCFSTKTVETFIFLRI